MSRCLGAARSSFPPFHLREHLARLPEGGVGGGHAAIDRGLQEDLADLLLRDAVAECRAHVHPELVLAVERCQGSPGLRPDPARLITSFCISNRAGIPSLQFVDQEIHEHAAAPRSVEVRQGGEPLAIVRGHVDPGVDLRAIISSRCPAHGGRIGFGPASRQDDRLQGTNPSGFRPPVRPDANGIMIAAGHARLGCLSCGRD